MITASPITRQTVGRTFIAAISALGVFAVAQLVALILAFVSRSSSPTPLAQTAMSSGNLAAALPGRTLPETEPMPSSDPNFAASPLEANPEANALASLGAAPPRPTPLPAKSPGLPEPEQSARFKESISQGKLLRDRGDMSTALTRFREAAAMDSKSPEALFEIAVTYEKMQLMDRAGEQWRRIYEMGESAGPYFTAAEARLNQVKESAMREAMKDRPEALTGAEAEDGIAPGKTLGLLPVTTEDHEDRNSAKHLSVRIPVKARAREKIEVRDLTIQVLFYDIVDNQSLMQTTAAVSSRWTTAPADWSDADTETLEVNYQLPLPDAKPARRENRKYFGYLVRVYYKGELQASAGEPERLLQQFPPEQRLPGETPRN